MHLTNVPPAPPLNWTATNKEVGHELMVSCDPLYLRTSLCAIAKNTHCIVAEYFLELLLWVVSALVDLQHASRKHISL